MNEAIVRSAAQSMRAFVALIKSDLTVEERREIFEVIKDEMKNESHPKYADMVSDNFIGGPIDSWVFNDFVEHVSYPTAMLHSYAYIVENIDDYIDEEDRVYDADEVKA